MSHTSLPLSSCPEIQDRLFEHFVQCNTETYFRQDEISFVKFLASGANGTKRLQEQTNPTGGKKRQVDLIYTPRIQPSELGSTPGKTCASSNEAGNRVETYNAPTTGAHWDEKMDMSDLELICQDDPSYFESRIMAGMAAILRKMDVDLVSDLQVLIGEFAPNEGGVVNNVKTVSSLNATNQVEHTFYDDVWFATENAGYCSRPVAFGWNEAYRAFRRANAGCCSEDGIDIQAIAAMTGTTFIPNRNIASTFSATDFITMSIGAVQLLRFNTNIGARGIREIDTETHKQTVLIEPETGIPFDFTMTYDCGDWILELDLAYEAVGMPTDAFSVGDEFEGVTQVNHFRITNP